MALTQFVIFKMNLLINLNYFFTFITIISGQSSEIIVTPTLNSTNCSCLTLTECTQEEFSSHTTLTFLDGYHTLDSDFTMSSLTNVSLRAPPGVNVTIDCGGWNGFAFQNIAGLIIENIVFVACGNSTSYPGLVLEKVNGTLINITLANSTSPVLIVGGDSRIEFVDLSVTNNSARRNGTDGTVAIVLLTECSVTFTGTTVFTDNRVFDANAPFELVQDELCLRTPENGSAIVYIRFASIRFDGSLAVTNNSSPAEIFRIRNCDFFVEGQSVFMGNRVGLSGVVAVFDAYSEFNGLIMFSSNSGGANGVSGIMTSCATVIINGSINFIGKPSKGCIYIPCKMLC